MLISEFQCDKKGEMELLNLEGQYYTPDGNSCINYIGCEKLLHGFSSYPIHSATAIWQIDQILTKSPSVQLVQVIHD